ncbi:MAG: hypothetical protein QGI86_28140, partial [Candidatus Poribacteria bacterium]|nr:hypothetical protein [Candidatus Poribacteria bacterium]
TQLPTGEMVEFNYLGNLVFQYTIYFSTTLEIVKTFSAIINRIIEAAQERGETALYLIIDASRQQSTSRPARAYLQQRMAKWAKLGAFTGLSVVNPNWFVRQSFRLASRLQPGLTLSFHLNQQEALAQIRQQQRQSVDQSEFLQWWQEAQQTLQVGDQSLKVVRRPQWVYETETGRLEHAVIEGETVLTNLSGVIEPDTIERGLEIINRIRAQLGDRIQYRIANMAKVTVASHLTRIKGAAALEQHQASFETTLMVPPAGKPGLAQTVYSLLPAAARQKTQLVDNLDQALQQLYGPVEIAAEVSVEKLSPADLRKEVSQLRQQIGQYQQQADRLTQQLSQMLWLTEDADSVDGLQLDSDSALGHLASVVEVVQS